MVFPVVVYGCELDYKESWAPKNWCFWTVVLEKTFESPLDCKEIHPVHPKGNQSWISNGWTDAEAEALILWPPGAKNWLLKKDPDAGKNWRQEKGTTENKMVEQHHWLDGLEFEQFLRALLWENICNMIIIFQFLGCPPSRCVIWFDHDCVLYITSLWLILCLWMQNIIFGRFQSSFLDDCSAFSCDNVFFLRGGESMFFYSAILSCFLPVPL